MLQFKKNIIYEKNYEKLDPNVKKFYNYTKSLKFDENPNYFFLKNLVTEIAEKSKISLDDQFEWCKNNKEKENFVKSNSKIKEGALVRQKSCVKPTENNQV